MKTLALGFLSCAAVATAIVSPNWGRCPNDPRVESCLKTAVQKAVKELALGSRIGFEDLGSITAERLTIIDQATGPFRGKFDYNRPSQEGLENTVIKDVENKGNGVLRITFFFPKLTIRGQYVMDTSLLTIPVKGSGTFTLVCHNLTDAFDFIIRRKVVDGHKVYETDAVKNPTFNVDFLQFNLTNLFNGNKVLGDNVNRILNDQWKPLSKDLAPLVINAFLPLYRTMSNSVLNKISADEFPLPV